MSRSIEEVQVSVQADDDDDKLEMRREFAKDNEDGVQEARENLLDEIRDEVLTYRALNDMVDELLEQQAKFIKKRSDALLAVGFSIEEATRITAALGLKLKEE